MRKSLSFICVFFVILSNTLAQTTISKSINQKEFSFKESDPVECPDFCYANVSNVSNTKSSQQDNVKDTVVDLWNSAEQIYTYDENCSFDLATNTITFQGSSEQDWRPITGIDEYEYYSWYTMIDGTYCFKGKLSSDGYAEIRPCIAYRNYNSDQNLILNDTTVILDENNGYSSEFEVVFTNNKIINEAPLSVYFGVVNSSTETTITSVENEFYCSYRTVIAEKWSEETDLPGLGLKDKYDEYYSYTVLCEDGVTTLGLYFDGYELNVTGINTTATEVWLPKNITIDSVLEKIDYFGNYNVSVDLTNAINLSKLHLEPVRYIYNLDLRNTNISDLYVASSCSIEYLYGASNVYLHVPYGCNRDTYYGFKRVLVGDEQPEYPETSYSDWVIAGENEGEYFGIKYLNNKYHIAEIFTEKDSVLLPVGTPAADGMYYIRGIGYDSYYYDGVLCRNAQNLQTITIPETYNRVEIYWSYNPITKLYMQGDVPSTYWSVSSNITVYVTNQDYFLNYVNNTSWNNASILPYGWDFEWMTVNVERKGEFAQTYIEMTNADWSLGKNVKVTGALNATDLGNIRNLTNLYKLDLSEAEFTELPSSFLSNMNSLTEVTFPNSLTSISNQAFYYCYNLSKVIAPNVTIVNDYAFYYCNRLKDFDFSNITTINSSAFSGCSSLVITQLSPELKTLGSNAFTGTAVKEISIPESITTINSGVFSDCKQLQKVTLHNSVISIGSNAFNNCSNLVDINLMEGITTIANDAFNNCSKITEITLPSTLQSIGYDIFDGCTSLSSVKCKAIVPPVTSGEFTYNVDLNHCTLYIAPFAIDAYRNAQDWNRFYIMKPLNEPVRNIYINRPMSFDLLSEDNAVLQDDPNMTLDYTGNNYNYNASIGQLYASGDGTLSAGVFTINNRYYRRNSGYNYDIRPTLINDAENMRADSVMYSIELEKNYWHFISFQYDVKMEDIFGLNNTDFVIRKYNSVNRASGDGTTSNWEQLSDNDILEAGKGYIIQAANNSNNENGNKNAATVVFPSRNTTTKNKLFTSNNAIVPLEEYPSEFAHNRSWNLVGNPYPCYYDMHYLADDFSTPIVLWRGSSYQAYSPIDDDVILRPNEAFFVQRPLNAEQMVFTKDGRMNFIDAYNANTTPGIKNTPTLTRANDERNVFNFTIEGNESDDRTRIVMNENASMDYEIECDASKFFAEVSIGAEIYINGNVEYDICERPFDDGIAVLGIRVANEGKYTISLDGSFDENWTVILKDTQTGYTVNMTEEVYQFDAKAGISKDRFILTFSNNEQTSINDIFVSEKDTHVRIYNVVGVAVYEGDINNFKATAKPGVYVVSGSEKTYKIVVK